METGKSSLSTKNGVFDNLHYFYLSFTVYTKMASMVNIARQLVGVESTS